MNGNTNDNTGGNGNKRNGDEIRVDDPRLTAFALGELEAGDVDEIARQVQRSPELQRTVADIRDTASALTSALQSESLPALTPSRREALTTEIVDSARSSTPDGASENSDQSRAREEADTRRSGKDHSLTVAALFGGTPPHERGESVDTRGSDEPTHEVWRLAHRITRRWYVPAAAAACVIMVVGALALYPPNVSRSRDRRATLDRIQGIGTSAKLYAYGNENKWMIPPFQPAGQQRVSGRSESDADGGDGDETDEWGGSIPFHLSQFQIEFDLAEAGDEEDWVVLMSANLAANLGRDRSAGPVLLSDWDQGGVTLQQVGANQTFVDVGGAKGVFFVGDTLTVQGGVYFDLEQRGSTMVVGGQGRSAADRAMAVEGFTRQERLALGETQPAVEKYDHIVENPFRLVDSNALSTFSIDVDTASYANVRRMLTAGMLPPAGAVRIEEMINYFDYDYPIPSDGHPFSVTVEIADCPWNGEHRLARIGLKGYEIEYDERPAANLVFLIDVSGSMASPDKLPLLTSALSMLVGELSRDDDVSIVVYAGASGMVLSPTSGDDKGAIHSALDRLESGGSTNGGAGIQLAYETALDNFIEGGINRVILATDGDFNVGVTSQSELITLIEDKARDNIFLSVLGFGMGNLKDSTLEKLADKGNGNYAYIDTLAEAQKVLVEQINGTLFTIAKDVKIQIEFNPAVVSGYRLIGYENRMLAAQDFNDDTKDAGEIGAGHTVTALYEIVPVGVEVDVPDVDPLKYQTPAEPSEVIESGEMMTIKLRYKEPDGDVSKLIELPIIDGGRTLDESSDDFAFASSVAAFGMLLRGSQYIPDYTMSDVLELANSSSIDEDDTYRTEFLTLVERAMALSGE